LRLNAHHDLSSVFCGGTFDFIVEDKRFTVYKALVSRASEALRAMMEGGMKESLQGFAPLPDVDMTTFARFVEFITTGEYNAAKPTGECGPDGNNSSDTDGPAHYYERCVRPVVPSMAARKSAPSLPFARPNSEKSLVPLPTKSQVPRYNQSRDFLPALKSHLDLHIFADRYVVLKLHKLTSLRLASALRGMDYCATDATNMPAFIRTAYERAPDLDGDDGTLRKLIIGFAAKNTMQLKKNRDFRDFLAEGGPFAVALLDAISERLADAEDSREEY
jgi:hypothetical protein